MPSREPARAASRASREELRVAQFVAVRHRLIRTDQLRDLGVSPSTTTRWVKRGRLRREHQGVYIYGGGELSQDGKFLAATLAIGDDAVVSHIAAAIGCGYWPHGTPPQVDVTVPRPLCSRQNTQ